MLNSRSKESDQKNIIDSFGGFIEQSSKHDLKTEQAFVDFAKQISAIILKEDRKKYVQEFVKELLTQVYPKLTSLEYEVVICSLKTLIIRRIFTQNALFYSIKNKRRKKDLVLRRRVTHQQQ